MYIRVFKYTFFVEFLSIFVFLFYWDSLSSTKVGPGIVKENVTNKNLPQAAYPPPPHPLQFALIDPAPHSTMSCISL